MLKFNINIGNKEALENHIIYVDRLLKMKTDVKFQNYIKSKCMETLNTVINSRLNDNNTNVNEIELYKQSNHIVDIEDGSGFILYNDAQIPADTYNIRPFDTSGYPNGMFSVALAFEYGTGVLDTTNISKSPSHKRLKDMWYLPKNVLGGSQMLTKGYPGYEIYRYTEIEIKKRLKSWVNSYFLKKGSE